MTDVSTTLSKLRDDAFDRGMDDLALVYADQRLRMMVREFTGLLKDLAALVKPK